MHPDFVYFLQWAHKKGLRKYFCTNGMRLDRLVNHIFDTETDIIAIALTVPMQKPTIGYAEGQISIKL